MEGKSVRTFHTWSSYYAQCSGLAHLVGTPLEVSHGYFIVTDSAQCNLILPSSTYISPSLSKLVPEPSSLPLSPQPPPSPPPPLVPFCPVPPATSQPTVPQFPPQPGSPTSHAVSNSHYALGNGGVSNCSIGIVSGEDIDLRKSHETVAKRKMFSPNTYN